MAKMKAKRESGCDVIQDMAELTNGIPCNACRISYSPDSGSLVEILTNEGALEELARKFYKINGRSVEITAKNDIDRFYGVGECEKATEGFMGFDCEYSTKGYYVKVRAYNDN